MKKPIVAAVLATCLTAAGFVTAPPASAGIALTGGTLSASDAHFNGEAPNDNAGSSVAGVGDVNADGFDDIVIGASAANSGDVGGAYLVLGGMDGWGTETRLSRPGVIEYVGTAAAENVGTAVAAAGDVNNDGFDDFLVGARFNDTVAANAGVAYLVLGSANPTSSSLSLHLQFTGEVALDEAGTSLSGADDVNGDGFDDFIVGAPGNAGGGAGAGAAYVVLGSAAPASGSLGSALKFTGAAGDAAGTSVAGGDFDGDGLGDILVGAPGNDTPGTDSGAAYLEPGATGLASGALDGVPPNTRMDGQSTLDEAGTSVALGDVNGDGRADAIIGAPQTTVVGGTGAVFVVLARPGLPTGSAGLGSHIQLDGELADDEAGTAVAAVGDVDGDDFGDFVVGAPLDTTLDRGAAYLVRGEATPGGALSTHIKYEGQLNSDAAGRAVGAAGDVNGDSLADFLVGSAQNDIVFSNAGAAYVIFGPSNPAPQSYMTRKLLTANSGDARPARFPQARAEVDFTAAARPDGMVSVRRHLFDPCDTTRRAARPIWDVDSNKVDPVNGSSLDLVFGYTTAEVLPSEEANLQAWTRPLGQPCAPWTLVPAADTQLDTAHNRITVSRDDVTTIGSFTLAPAPALSVADVSVSEGGSATFTVKASQSSLADITVTVQTANASALAPGDYTASGPTVLTIPAGQTSVIFQVPTTEDALDETNETFVLDLSGASSNATIGDAQATAAIVDDDAAPTIRINDVAVTEPDSGTKAMRFIAKLSSPSGKTVTVNFATANSTAVAPSDYVAKTGALTFSPGQTTKTITVNAKGDLRREATERFKVNLSAPVNASIADAQGLGTIRNDD